SGAGALRLTIATDASNVIAEGNVNGDAESNNTKTFDFSSALAAYPDLEVIGLAVHSSSAIQAGSTLTISWSDANTGNGPVDVAFVDSVTIHNATTNQVLGTMTFNFDPAASGALAGGSSLDRSFQFNLPQGDAGAGEIVVDVMTDA